MNFKKFFTQGMALAVIALPAFADNREEPRAAMRSAPAVSTSSQRAIERTLGSVLSNVLSGDFDDVVDNLAKPDRERIDRETDSQAKNLEPAVTALKNNWKEKYNQSSITPATIAYEYLQGSNDKSVTVRLPERSGERPITLKLVDEGSITATWRIDVPDALSGTQLRESLISGITRLNEDKNSWPSTPAQAYQVVAQRIFAAVGEGSSESR